MNLGSVVRSKLPECGDCINCKLIIWSETAQSKNLRSQSSVKLSENSRCYFTVRCNWLKTVIEEPLYLQKCEGKKS